MKSTENRRNVRVLFPQLRKRAEIVQHTHDPEQEACRHYEDAKRGPKNALALRQVPKIGEQARERTPHLMMGPTWFLNEVDLRLQNFEIPEHLDGTTLMWRPISWTIALRSLCRFRGKRNLLRGDTASPAGMGIAHRLEMIGKLALPARPQVCD